MSNFQMLLEELQSLTPNYEIRIVCNKQRYADGVMTPYTCVNVGDDYNDNWEALFIDEKTGDMLLEKDIKLCNYNNYYECYEGGFEDDAEDCIKRMIEKIKGIKKCLIKKD